MHFDPPRQHRRGDWGIRTADCQCASRDIGITGRHWRSRRERRSCNRSPGRPFQLRGRWISPQRNARPGAANSQVPRGGGPRRLSMSGECLTDCTSEPPSHRSTVVGRPLQFTFDDAWCPDSPPAGAGPSRPASPAYLRHGQSRSVGCGRSGATANPVSAVDGASDAGCPIRHCRPFLPASTDVPLVWPALPGPATVRS